jgi:hypothetical protein
MDPIQKKLKEISPFCANQYLSDIQVKDSVYFFMRDLASKVGLVKQIPQSSSRYNEEKRQEIMNQLLCLIIEDSMY